MRSINRSLVFEAIWTRGPISRADLAKEMRLSPATVSAITDELLQEGVIVEQGLGRSQGGRRPVMLSVNADARRVIALYVSVHGIEGAVTDLRAAVLHHRRFPVDLSHAAGLLNTVETAACALLEEAHAAGVPVLGIGIACPGLIDRDRGVLRYASGLGQVDLALAARLSERCGLPAVVDNDQNAAALAELHCGSGRGYDNLLYVSVDLGIGAGIVIDGKVYDGPRGGAGELGHMTIDTNGPPCRCGNRGCLGVLAGGTAMIAQAVRLVQQRADTILLEFCDGDIRRLRVEHIIRGAQLGDRMALSIFQGAMEYLGAGIASLVNLLAPELIVLGGCITHMAADMVLEAVRASVRARSLPAHHDEVRIVPATAGTCSGPVGAALLVIHGLRFARGVAVS